MRKTPAPTGGLETPPLVATWPGGHLTAKLVTALDGRVRLGKTGGAVTTPAPPARAAAANSPPPARAPPPPPQPPPATPATPPLVISRRSLGRERNARGP